MKKYGIEIKHRLKNTDYQKRNVLQTMSNLLSRAVVGAVAGAVAGGVALVGFVSMASK